MEQQTLGSRRFIPWSDIPKELAERIGNCLDTSIDVLHFRSVCTTWRSSLAPFKIIPHFPFEIPFPLDHRSIYKGRPGYHLIESTVYLFQPLDADSIDSPCKGWLIKVIKTADGKLRFLNPLTGRLIQDLPHHMPKVLNLLDFRVSQVCKSYHVQYFMPSKPFFRDYDVGYVRKIVLLRNHNAGSQRDSFSLMAIDRSDLLCYLKSGDDKWTTLKDASSYIDDIIVYKGNFYAVDRYGDTMKFDSSFNETAVASRFSDGGRRKKRLVESGGQLFLVDSSSDLGKDVSREIKMYQLDEEQNEWIEVHTLNDGIYFAVNDCCFSVSSRDFGDKYCRGNCIYYVKGRVYYDDEDSDDDIGMCGCCCAFGDDDLDPVVAGDDEISYPISNNNDQTNESGRKSGCDDLISASISNDDHKMNASSSKSGGVREEQAVDRYKGVLDDNTCVFTIEDGKLGSLLSSLDYAEILWPPPSWLNGEDQTPPHAHEIAESLLSINKGG
ncbi:F-box protein SKIP23 [Solanum dulcamara]|uniref:F-box protein SKIP23 n=1 Tax=Solanum dulcamara TaxID=45834 RepID=UPI0024856D9D|nr:F-box protein SKIP23 [Solanum dulcamara]